MEGGRQEEMSAMVRTRIKKNRSAIMIKGRQRRYTRCLGKDKPSPSPTTPLRVMGWLPCMEKEGRGIPTGLMTEDGDDNHDSKTHTHTTHTTHQALLTKLGRTRVCFALQVG